VEGAILGTYHFDRYKREKAERIVSELRLVEPDARRAREAKDGMRRGESFALATALAVGLWLSALNVQYRDVRYTIAFLTQLWLFATPVAYPASLLPERWRVLMGLNPMAGVVEAFRWALLGTSQVPGPMIAVSVVIVIGMLTGGLFYFRRTERRFADLV